MPLMNTGKGSEGCPKAEEGWLLDQGFSGRPSCQGSSPSAEGFPHLLAPAPLPLLVLGCSGVGKGVDPGETGSGEKEKKNLFHDAPGLQTRPLETLPKSTGGHGSRAVQSTGSQAGLGGPP